MTEIKSMSNTKRSTIIWFLILLAIGGLILYPKKKPVPENVPLNAHGDTQPATAVIQGPTTPPPQVLPENVR